MNYREQLRQIDRKEGRDDCVDLQLLSSISGLFANRGCKASEKAASEGQAQYFSQACDGQV